MIPLRDENPSHRTPFAGRFLIAANVLAFAYETLLGPELRGFTFEWGMVPLRLKLALEAGSEPVTAAAFPLLTSMFLHGGILHLLGNMWYLWIFGDNIEDRFGHLGFLLFYITSGLAAGLFHYLFNATSSVPAIGASGAIAGVLGAYLVAFPHARIMTLIPFFPFTQVAAIPAVFMLGFWFVLQFFSGALSLAGGARGGGGVAWWAHVGGFAFGVLAMAVMGRRRRESAARTE